MNRLFTVFAGCALMAGLTACGSDEKVASSNTETATTTSSNTSTATPSAEYFSIGDTVNVGIDGEVVNMTLTAAQVGGECFYGAGESDGEPDGQLLQLWAEVETNQLAHNSSAALENPQVITQDEATQTVDLDRGCMHSTEGHSLWQERLDPVEKIRVYGAFRVPTGFESLKFNQYRITAVDLEKGTNAPTQEPAPAVEEPYVVRCLDGTPGPAEWSDGTTRYSEECFQKLGGPAYLESEAGSGLEAPCDGPAYLCGYGEAPNGARNPTSGEIQTYHGCQEGYITDPALCAGAEDVIRAADPNGELYW